ncbi:hypothetical protein, partial [Spirosoma sp. 209]|uniref:hypothetical protein n=1 Tax=Spirosoma sp. 209 TaxID=1955701 RepID=UPI001F32A9E4
MGGGGVGYRVITTNTRPMRLLPTLAVTSLRDGGAGCACATPATDATLLRPYGTVGGVCLCYPGYRRCAVVSLRDDGLGDT